MSVRRGPRPAGERLRRLLVMLPWLMERGEVPLADVARQFDLTPAEVERDIEMVAMCGLPPYVDEMVDVFVDEGVVYTGVPRLFSKPLRLTAPEGVALLIAGRAAMQMPGAESSGPLGRALDRLAEALGDEGTTVVELGSTPLADALSAAAARHERVALRYWTPSRDEVTDRQVTARQVAVVQGRWYLIADDLKSGEERVFRLDRIESAAPLGVFDEPRVVTRSLDGDWFVGSDLATARLTVSPAGSWVAERHPTRSTERLPDGSSIIELVVVDDGWFADLLVRLGPAVLAVNPVEWRARAAERARAVLAVYEVGDS
jgi:proteasome accessory factor C